MDIKNNWKKLIAFIFAIILLLFAFKLLINSPSDNGEITPNIDNDCNDPDPSRIPNDGDI